MAPSSKPVVYYCLNGIGYFGQRSLATAVQLVSYLPTRRSSRSLQIFALSDLNPSALDSADRSLRHLKAGEPILCNSLTALLAALRRRYAEGMNKGDTFLVHDCSPTWAHLDNSNKVRRLLLDIPGLQKHFKYLVEKPAMTATQVERRVSSGEGVHALPPGGSCDYLEVQSRTYLSVKKWLRENPQFVITDMTVWRSGSTGFKKLFDRDRAGVTGGALEDKASHDLALTLGYLGSPVGDPTVVQAAIRNFLPAHWDPRDPSPRFTTVDDHVTGLLDRRLTTEGLKPARI